MTPVEWGSVAAWAGAAGTVLVVITTSLVALGVFERSPRLRLSFERAEPWIREGRLPSGESVAWYRVRVENTGSAVAEACVGRLLSAETGGAIRADIDPLQLRWAGVPRSRAFEPMPIRPRQVEYLNVVYSPHTSPGGWRIVTFEDPDFDPGFTLELAASMSHRIRVAVFSAKGEARALELDLGA